MSSDDERLRDELAAVGLSRPGVGVEDVMRRTRAQRRSRRAMKGMVAAAVGVWLVVWVAGNAVERSLAAMQGVTAIAPAQNWAGRPANSVIELQRSLAEGTAIEDLGTDVEPLRTEPTNQSGVKVPGRQGRRPDPRRDEAEHGRGGRAYV